MQDLLQQLSQQQKKAQQNVTVCSSARLPEEGDIHKQVSSSGSVQLLKWIEIKWSSEDVMGRLSIFPLLGQPLNLVIN